MKPDQNREKKLRKRCKWLRWSPQASEALLEGLIELVGILVLGGIGWGVVALIGVGADHWNVDFETLVIIGVAVSVHGVLLYVFEKTQLTLLVTVGTVLLLLGIVVGLGISFYAMKKYNKGIF